MLLEWLLIYNCLYTLKNQYIFRLICFIKSLIITAFKLDFFFNIVSIVLCIEHFHYQKMAWNFAIKSLKKPVWMMIWQVCHTMNWWLIFYTTKDIAIKQGTILHEQDIQQK